MNRLLPLIGLLFFISCSGGSSDNAGSSDTLNATDPATPAIQNVNGNVPDTSNTVTLNQPQNPDSSRTKDSIRR